MTVGTAIASPTPRQVMVHLLISLSGVPSKSLERVQVDQTAPARGGLVRTDSKSRNNVVFFL